MKKYLFCFACIHPQNGISYGDSITSINSPLNEEALKAVRESIAKKMGLSESSQIAFTSVCPLES